MNKAAIIMALADGPPIEYRAAALTAAATTTINKPPGVEVGDLVLVWAQIISNTATLTTTTGSAWGRILCSFAAGGPNNSSLFWKVLSATDVSQTWVLSAAPDSFSQSVRYTGHGASTVTAKTTVSQGFGGTSLNLTGFTKSAGHYGTISVFTEASVAGSPVVPVGFTERVRTTASGAQALIADQMYGYVSGASVFWTGADAGPAESAMLLEVTGQ